MPSSDRRRNRTFALYSAGGAIGDRWQYLPQPVSPDGASGETLFRPAELPVSVPGRGRGHQPATDTPQRIQKTHVGVEVAKLKGGGGENGSLVRRG